MAITTTLLDAGDFRASVVVDPSHPRSNLAAEVEAVLDRLPVDASPIQIWIEQASDDDTAAIAHLARPYRDLLQLRRPLPSEPSGLQTRAFEPDRDADEWIEVNNRAFSWHPEQAGMTRERLDAAMAEPWFRADGFRILEIDERIAGFCWTKVHTDAQPVIGEIYVIAVDPDFHGRGLGGPMTLAGLEWLSDQGITVANLYVESDNEPAVRTYERLGFSTYAINRAHTTATS